MAPKILYVTFCCWITVSFFLSAAQSPFTHSTPVTAVSPVINQPRITVVPDHASGVYNLGQKITWTVDVVGDRSGTGSFVYVVKNDGAVEIGKGLIDLTKGGACITASRNDPGIVVVQLFPAAKKGAQPRLDGTPVAVGGAAVSPGQIKPAFPTPADFDSFWQSKLKDLTAVPINPVVEQSDISGLKFAEKVNYCKVRLDNINGTHVYGQLARPKVGHKFPAMLILQYAGVYPLDKNQVIAKASLGWLVFNINAHDLPIDRPAAFYKKAMATTQRDYAFAGAEDKETCYFLRMFLGCARAVDYLVTRPDWDGKILVVTGASQGGLQSFVTAALRPKEITALSVNVPAACDIDGPLAKPPHQVAWPFWISSLEPKGRDLTKTAQTAGYYDAINFAARVHCPSLVSVGLIDDAARPTGVIAAYNVIPGPKKLIILPLSDHHGSNNAQRDYYQATDLWFGQLQKGITLPIPDPPGTHP